MKLTAYPLSGVEPDIRPARPTRAWLDALPQQFGYRCLPLNIASQHGWEVCAPTRVTAEWDSGAGTDAIRVTPDEPHPLNPASHFGHGILTFHIGALLRTPPGINLLVTAPFNHPKDGVCGLSGIIETDWSPYPFTMNWKFTTAGIEATWEKGEPFAVIMPVPRGLMEAVEPEFQPLDSDPELAERYREWAASRSRFNRDLHVPDSEAARERWQKGYYRGVNPDGSPGHDEHETKARGKPFAR